MMKKISSFFMLIVFCLALAACGGGEKMHTLDIRNTGDKDMILAKVVIDGQVYLDDEYPLPMTNAGAFDGKEYLLTFTGGKKVNLEYTLMDAESRQTKDYKYTFTDSSGTGGTFFIEYLNWKPIYKTSAGGAGVMPLTD